MAEAHARIKQYDYTANSNLVLTTDTRPLHQPTGEPESLWRRINPRHFGDRAAYFYGTAPELDEKLEKFKRRKSQNTELPSKRQRLLQDSTSVLTIITDDTYQPKTEQTRVAYEALLCLIQQHLGEQPQDILHSAADEVLAVLKNDKIKGPDKKVELGKLLNTLSTERFTHLTQIGKLITDYVDGSNAGAEGAGEALDADIGVAVEFEEEEEDDEIDLDVVQEEESEEDDGAEVLEIGGMQMGGINDDNDVEEADEGLNVQDIDAYWLQRRISQAYGNIQDPQQCRKLAEEVLETLVEADDRAVENHLVMLLDYNKFDLIKVLMKNRLKVVWCTRLARAEDDAERRRIREEMNDGGPALSAIAEQLRATKPTAIERQKNVERSIREEARKLKDCRGEAAKGVGGASAGGWADGQRQMLDLDQLTFHQGGLLMANTKCEFPNKIYRRVEKGYEEVHVPHLKPQPIAEGEELVRIAAIPDWAQPAFAEMKTLNRVQSRVYETALFTPENLLLCAPTGAGKTNVAMLTILHEIGIRRKEDGTIDLSGFKVVYVAPMKALVAEVVGNLSKRLQSYGVTVKELTGDQTLSKRQIEEAQIIVTTPEKWDVITRKSGHRTYTESVRLLIIDEIHLLHDTRGPVLESIIARTVRQIEATRDMIRLVGLSATLPNFEDVALFLRVDKLKGLFFFDNSYRPCPLTQQYIGITEKKAFARFELMNNICYDRVLAAAGKKHQVLVFVHSRKETARSARFLRDRALGSDILFLKEDSASREILRTESESVKSSDLRDLLPYGFAIHHAGMTRLDRTLVEELFADGHIQVLVSTATLAWGVNLPAHTVIIKGTQVYCPEKGAWTELSPLDVMQMLGRAGRPQYDTYGEGIIITGHTELRYYLSLMNQQLPIESQLISRLADNLNAEIVLGTVQNAKEARVWLGYTYLYIRMLRNPVLYGISVDALQRDSLLEERRADLIHSAASVLDRNNLIKYDKKTGSFQATDLGRIASFYYITHGTMATYNEHLKPSMGDIELCRLFSLSEEFKNVTVRKEEKMELGKLMERVPIPVKEVFQEEASAKINVLLQAYISQLKLEGLSLTADMVFILQSAGRLMRALFEIALRRRWAQLAEKALTLCKMVQRRMWRSHTPLRQFGSLKKDVLSRIEKKNLAWECYSDFSFQEIGELVRAPKLGKTLHKLIHQVPKLELAAGVLPITRSVLKVELTITPDFQWDEKVHGFAEPFWIIAEDHDGERILHHEYFVLEMHHIDEDHLVIFTLPIHEPTPPQYFIRVISDRWLGSETVLPVSFHHLRLPERFPPPTELLDLQPLPVSALRNPTFEALYSQFKHFNPVQTQVFGVLYNTDDNALIAAPTGSGKTLCAEFAVMRMLEKGSEKRCVYVAPVEVLAKERYVDWEAKFGRQGLGCRVAELTGDTAVDLKILERSQITITTPERWDQLSRKWKQRKQVMQQVSLFIVDELHLIGEQVGPVLEVIVSRMRYISSRKENGSPIRIIALSTSLANAKDVGEWIGAPPHGLFNFPPGARPVPLDISIQGIDTIAHLDARVQAMIKPTYSAITQQSPGKPVLVFVPTRKHARLTALDLVTYSSNTEGSEFLHCKQEYLNPFLEKIGDSALVHALGQGVAYLHEGLTDAEQEIVGQLFAAGAIQVCVASSSMCWGMTLVAHLVVVMGTQLHSDGCAKAPRDYPIADLLQMVGRATRPLVGGEFGKCIILCHAPQKEYYKKFVCEPLPVESHLDHFLHDHMNAEVVMGTIQSKQDAVDYLTWTFMYRRLTQNPNYYNLQGTSHQHLSDHLSELVENILSDLETSKCIQAAEEDMDLSPLNLGLIASYYYISYTTMELFSSSLTAKTKIKGLLEILASASEYSKLPVRPGEKETVQKMINHQRFGVECTNPHVKANVLLQAHFSGHVVTGALALDQRQVVLDAGRLVQAMVDVASSNGWLNPALAAMEMSQMVTQGLWENDSPLLQLPHFTKELARKCRENPGRSIETVFELVEMEDDERRRLLQMTDRQLMDIARVCNRLPNIDVAYEVVDADEITAGDKVTLQVSLERELSESMQELGPVDAPRFPKPKQEGWWLVVGDPKSNQLEAIKRVSLQREAKLKLAFTAPPKVVGRKSYTLFFMCDAYLGCDQEYEFTIDVRHQMEGEKI
ncbi:hypothetical protein L7F22_037769 [Adiantum nelumboides]|nr:hypothetical protein [Adiantum nelumboides]